MEHPTPTVRGEAREAGGGDPACWAQLVCAECGAVKTEGHCPGCRYEQADASRTDRGVGS